MVSKLKKFINNNDETRCEYYVTHKIRDVNELVNEVRIYNRC